MWKQARESGLSLAELLVVLAITVVLAAILMPAVTPPGQTPLPGEKSEDISAYTVLAEEVPRARANDRAASRRERQQAMEDSTEETGLPLEILPASFEPERETATMERNGLEKIKTTDIRYVAP